jgi:hypothetical protein
MTTLTDMTVSAVAGADGSATVTFNGPGMSFDVLDVDVIVTTSDSTSLPNVTLYRGAPALGRRLAFNADGRGGTFRGGGVADYIGAGDSWSVKWEGCAPGSTCSATLTGMVRRR